MEIPVWANRLNQTSHMLRTDQDIPADIQIKKVWICQENINHWAPVANSKLEYRLVILNLCFILASPKELIKRYTNAQKFW